MTQQYVNGLVIGEVLREALDSDDVEFYYNPKGEKTMFPLVVINASISKDLRLCVKLVCSADSIWRGYYRDVVFSNLRVYSVCLLDSCNQEHSTDVDKSKVNLADFLTSLANYFERLKLQCEKEKAVDFRAWNIDNREMENILKKKCLL